MLTRTSKKGIGLLTVALFLIAAVIPGHVGHLSISPHSSSHDPATGQDQPLASLHEQVGAEQHSDKDECDHAHELACSVGHCCYPVPEIVLTHANFEEPHDQFDLAFSHLRDRRVDVPPPRFS